MAGNRGKSLSGNRYVRTNGSGAPGTNGLVGGRARVSADKGEKHMKIRSVAVLALCMGLMAVPAMAQDAAKKDAAPKPAVGLAQAVLEQWNDIGRKLIAMAEDFPEDKYDVKPTPAPRSVAEQLLHAAGANYFFTNIAMGEKPPAQEDPQRAKYNTKAYVVAFVKKSFECGSLRVNATGDAG